MSIVADNEIYTVIQRQSVQVSRRSSNLIDAVNDGDDWGVVREINELQVTLNEIRIIVSLLLGINGVKGWEQCEPRPTFFQRLWAERIFLLVASCVGIVLGVALTLWVQSLIS